MWLIRHRSETRTGAPKERGRPLHCEWVYGLRWSIEPNFSDYKTRGFNLQDSRIERTDRLVQVLSLTLYWAVSAGMWDAMENKTPAGKGCDGAPRARMSRAPKSVPGLGCVKTRTPN